MQLSIYLSATVFYGRFDFTIGKTNFTDWKSYNGSRALGLLDSIEEIKCAARSFNMFAIAKRPSEFVGYDDGYYTDSGLYQVASIIDIEEEQKRGLLKGSPLRPLGPNQTYVTQNFLDRIKATTNSGFVIRWKPFRIRELQTSYLILYKSRLPRQTNSGYVRLDPVLIPAATPIIKDHNLALNQIQVVQDARTYFSSYRILGSPQTLSSQNFTGFVRNSTLSDYANYIVCKLAEPNKLLREYGLDETKKIVYGLGNKIAHVLGGSAVRLAFFLLRELERYKDEVQSLIIISAFVSLGIIAISMTIIYVILGILLEKHQRDDTIIKVVGSGLGPLLGSMLIYVLVITLTSIVLSYGLSIMIYSAMRKGFSRISDYEDENEYTIFKATYSNWITAIMVAIAIPLITLALRTLQFTSHSLVSVAKDTSNTQSIVAQIHKPATSFSPLTSSTFLLATASATLSLLALTVLPYTLLNASTSSSTLTSFLLLTALILGLTILLANFSPILVFTIGRIICSLDRLWVGTVVETNLGVNRRRGRFLIIVFTLTLSLISLLFSSVQSYMNSIQYSKAIAYSGADYVFSKSPSSARINKLTKSMDDANISFSSSGIYDSLQKVLPTRIYSFAKFKAAGLNISSEVAVYPVHPEIYRYLSGSLHPPQYTSLKHNNIDPLQILYSRFGQAGAIISDNVAQKFSLDCTHKDKGVFHLNLGSTTHDYSTFQLQCLGSASYLAGLNFTSDPSVERTEALISLESFVFLLDEEEVAFGTQGLEKNLSFHTYFLEISSRSPQQLRQAQLIIQENNAQKSYDVLNTQEVVGEIEGIDGIFTTIYSMSIGVCFTVNFFFLILVRWMSTRDQSKQIGIMRCFGASTAALLRIPIYESASEVLTGTLLGLMISTSTAYLVSSSTSMLSGLPMVYSIPVRVLYLTPVLALLSGCLSALLPQWWMLHRPILSIIK